MINNEEVNILNKSCIQFQERQSKYQKKNDHNLERKNEISSFDEFRNQRIGKDTEEEDNYMIRDSEDDTKRENKSNNKSISNIILTNKIVQHSMNNRIKHDRIDYINKKSSFSMKNLFQSLKQSPFKQIQQKNNLQWYFSECNVMFHLSSKKCKKSKLTRTDPVSINNYHMDGSLQLILNKQPSDLTKKEIDN